MSARAFITSLVITTVIAVAFVYGMTLFPLIEPFSLLGWGSIAFFILWSILMFFISSKAAANENKNVFTNAILGFTFAKLFLSGGIIYAYFRMTEPDSRLFLIPFFGVYLIYTIFETQFMMKLGKTEQANEK